jgi:hypothetical protein
MSEQGEPVQGEWLEVATVQRHQGYVDSGGGRRDPQVVVRDRPTDSLGRRPQPAVLVSDLLVHRQNHERAVVELDQPPRRSAPRPA